MKAWAVKWRSSGHYWTTGSITALKSLKRTDSTAVPLILCPILRSMKRRTAVFLETFLDPDGTHGQGNVFLVPFLDELGVPESGSGLWRVTVETGRVDILVWRNHPEKCAVIIENKSNGAGDRPNQIYRYWHQEMFLWDPALWTSKDPAIISEQKRRFHVVYLPTDGGKSPQSHSMERPLGFENVNPFPRVPLKCRILPSRT